MQLHNIPKSNKKRAQRIGRGGKRGTTSGRGQKGQKSRSGRRIRPAERDLIIRLPKKRGFHNKPKSPPALVLQLSDLKKLSGPVSHETLREANLVPRRYSGGVKILSGGAA